MYFTFPLLIFHEENAFVVDIVDNVRKISPTSILRLKDEKHFVTGILNGTPDNCRSNWCSKEKDLFLLITS